MRLTRIARSQNNPLVVSPLALAEFDFLLRTVIHGTAARAILDRLFINGTIEVPALTLHDLHLAVDVDRRYAALDLGLTDATLVVLAERYNTRDLLTRDERDFRPVVPLQGGTFRLLPRDFQS
jgi:predicted nucleic acid-binding protein